MERFQTTYEELKLPIIESVRALGESFQTTYEELKRIKVYCLLETASHASRLPMRNWNFHRLFLLPEGHCTLPDYLWGIETPFTDEFSLELSFRLPDYLWGIETGGNEIAAVQPGSSLPDYLWGIETVINNILSYMLYWASRLPMRNWNLAIRKRLCKDWPASRLPMRNWNLKKTSVGCGRKTRFQTTYEELKLYNRVREKHSENGNSFQTTYEELKPDTHLVVQALTEESFQTTYEELKRWWCLFNQLIPSRASRLPMRNWNSSVRFSTRG